MPIYGDKPRMAETRVVKQIVSHRIKYSSYRSCTYLLSAECTHFRGRRKVISSILPLVNVSTSYFQLIDILLAELDEPIQLYS